MRKISFILGSVALCFGLASCNKSEMDTTTDRMDDRTPVSFTNGVITKGYVDGTRFYEKAVADLHSSTADLTARKMRVSAYINPQEGSGRNYFIDEEFASNGLDGAAEKWVHTPALYWPLGGNMDFLSFSSTEPFAAKDAVWNDMNAAAGLVLTFDENRTQDDVLYACASGKSADASANDEQVYTTGQPVAIQFQHAQAWLEFQLSVADSTMMDKIAIKEIVIDGAYDKGILKLTRNTTATTHTVDAVWQCDGLSPISFDDRYGVYGHLKQPDEYTEEKEALEQAQSDLVEAQNGGDSDAIAQAREELAAKEAALQAAYESYSLVNSLNAVGNNAGVLTPSSEAGTNADCAYLDMLLPQQNKTSFIIRYVLAGNPEVLEYRFTPKNSGSDKWEMGKKYIYDIDFVISEITFAPTVKEFEASFDGETNPIEII